MRLDHAMIFVKDLERMTRFYCDVVGLTPTDVGETPGYVEFSSDMICFALHAVPAHEAALLDISHPPTPREHQPFKLTFAVDNVDQELIRLEGLGVPILRRPWGGWDFVDPEGNVLGVRSQAAP